MFGPTKPANSSCFNTIVSAHLYLNEHGKKEVEILSMVADDDEGTDIFCDKEDMLCDAIDIGDTDDYYFMAHIRAWFHTYNDYFDGPQADVEFVVTELATMENFTNLTLTHEQPSRPGGPDHDAGN